MRVRTGAVLALTGLATAVSATDASAGQVFRPGGSDTITFLATLGEVNDVTITQGAGFVTVSDAGAPLTAGVGCSSVDANTATCDDAGVNRVSADLVDLDDRLTSTAAHPGFLDGGDGDDVMTGGPAAEWIDGQGGADTIAGAGGNDQIRGGGVTPFNPGLPDGGDRIDGGDGDDVVGGDAGADAIDGGAGADDLAGDTGADQVAGGDGDDSLGGGEEADLLDGGPGNDTIGNPLRLTLQPFESHERGSDVLRGGEGDDLLFPGTGSTDGGGDADRIEGGAGRDVVDYGRRTAGLQVAKNGAADDGAPGEGDDVGLDVERIQGGAANDVLRGSAGSDDIDGGPGADDIDGLAGDDLLNGGAGDGGNDRVEGGDGNDAVLGDGGDDRASGGGGADVVSGGTGGDTLGGGGGDDRLAGDEGRDTLTGDPGADVMSGGLDVDTAIYDDARGVQVRLDDLANDGALVRPHVTEPGNVTEGDNVVAVEDVTGAGQDDTFVGASGTNALSGGAGEDYVEGRGGGDQLSGDTGIDVINARDRARDVVSCGQQADIALVDSRDRVRRSGRNRCEFVDDGRDRTPRAGRDVVVDPLGCSGGARLGLAAPGAARLVPLTTDARLPVRSTLDAEDCRVRVTTAASRRAAAGEVVAEVSGGEFEVRQSRRGVTTLRLHAPSCAAAGARDRGAEAARHDNYPYKLLTRVGRRPRRAQPAGAAANGRGPLRLRVVARSSTATALEASRWRTIEHCDVTETEVLSGRVRLAGLLRRRYGRRFRFQEDSVVLSAGERSFARLRYRRRLG